MKLFEITKWKIPPQLANMSVEERHDILEFIGFWLSGRYMAGHGVDSLSKWQEIAKMFPPKVSGSISLYRLVTVPIEYAKKSEFRFRPAPASVGSWTQKLTGLDSVAGVARELDPNSRYRSNYADESQTARIGISANIPADLILATPQTIRDCVMAISHDYFERYPETEKVVNGIHRVEHPGYPGKDPGFYMDEVGFLHDVLNRRGGNYKQYEVIVQTPPTVDAKVVRIYRLGTKIVRAGNDDPHS